MTAMDKRKTDRPQAIAMYQSGLSVGDVATFYGVTRQAMWEWLKARGVKMRPQLKFGKDNHFHRNGKTANDKAQNTLETAIQRGIVNRKVVCEKCSATPTFKDGRTGIQAHHCDYNKPLDVMWLCQRCHHEWHKNNKAIMKKGG